MFRIAMCSFGKDSLATLIECKKRNIRIDLVVYSRIMFSHALNISAEHPLHDDFIFNKAIPFVENVLGYHVKVVYSEKDYLSIFHHKKIRGKFSGKINGFPIANRCAILRDLKLAPVHKFLKVVKAVEGRFIQILGIAYDEKSRLDSMHKNPLKYSYLEKFKINEIDCYNICKEYDMLSPIYDFSFRNGCWFCPNQSKKQLLYLYKNYPSLYNYLLQLDNVPNRCSPCFSFANTFYDLHNQILSMSLQFSMEDLWQRNNHSHQ